VLIPSCAIHQGIDDQADRNRKNSEAVALGFTDADEKASCSNAGVVSAKACKNTTSAGGFKTAAELEEAKKKYDCLSKECINAKIMISADLMDETYGTEGRNSCENEINDYIKNKYSYDYKTKTGDDNWEYTGYESSYVGAISYYTDDILLQTELGAYRKSRINCIYDVKLNAVAGVNSSFR
jgi:hypothetical protein